ncbi:MAG TPA: twin-arginine translocation signal domain-containing protein, partial [Gemmatimonadaceae bacterium]|nr:twin-arginine translocation signal domain-containing protein [Gemmatimonadaceae bacterium]
MLIRKPDDIKSSEITPERDYVNRRAFLKLAGGVGAIAAGSALAPRLLQSAIVSSGGPPEDKLNSWDQITSYNNYYEFGTEK